MVRDITIGQYIPGESLLHKADPRTKMVLMILYMTIIFLVDTYVDYLIVSLFTVLIVIGSKIPIKYAAKGIKPVVLIIVITAVINAFTTPGISVLKYGIFRYITIEGVDLSIKMILRITLLMIVASMITFTTTPIALTDGIEKLMKPLKKVKIPVHEVAMMISIALRFIPTIIEEMDKIIKAQSSRGADFDTGNFIKRAKSYVPVLVPLFISAFRRADELAAAMEARCYRGDVGRTRMKQLKFTYTDMYISLVMGVFCATVLFLRYMGL